MKTIISILFILIIISNNNLISQNESTSSLNLDALNDEQIKTFNRNKITIEAVGQSIGNFNRGYFQNDITSTSWYQWTAYIGFDKPLTEEEFFKKTGYIQEGNMSKSYKEEIEQLYVFGFIGAIGGLAIMFISEDKEETFGSGKYATSYTIKEYPYRTAGLIISSIGSGLLYGADIARRKNYSPYSSVKNIADVYNKALIKNILEGKIY